LLDVLEHLPGLGFNVSLANNVSVAVHGRLPGNVNRVSVL
jgi:hypothetical protein